ncbi:MAG: hypothetical protein ACRENP_26505 [Longimicrobiales bacterium]
MRKNSLFFGLACAALVAACEDTNDPVFIFEESAGFDLVGVWAGVAEITTAEKVGTNFGGGFTFPVVLSLRLDRRFELITANFPTSYFDESDRDCKGVYTVEGNSVRFFAEETCRALPLSRYSVGRVIPSGLTLSASTLNTVNQNNATIRVLMRLDRD